MPRLWQEFLWRRWWWASAAASVDGCNSRGIYEFARPRPVTIDDMEYAVERSEQVRLEEDRMILHLFPQDFTLDGRSGKRYPRGSTCSRLEANVHIVTCSEQEHHAILHAVQQASYAVEESMFEPVATAYASVNRDDRNRGVAVVDIGKHSTDMVVYDGEAVLLARSLAISADHFTRDVAVGLTVQYNDAERLKIEYGCAMLGLTSDNSYIEVPSNEGRTPREAPRKQLNEILEARAEELFIHVGSELVTIGMDQKLLEGVILAGGGAMLNGMCDMAERVLNCPGAQRDPGGHSGFSGRLVHAGVGHRVGAGELFGAAENESGDQTQGSRFDGYVIPMSQRVTACCFDSCTIHRRL